MSKKNKFLKRFSEPLLTLYSKTFQKIMVKVIRLFKRDKSKNRQTQEGYPDPYYALVYKAMQELLLNNNQRFKLLEQSVIGGGWLLNTNIIAEETYRYLWYNMLFAVKNENDDAVITYWKNAFQFFQYSLRQIDEIRDKEEFRKILNIDEIDKRKNERTRFLEFHYALGGLLLYKKRYNCIKRIFEFTNSEPPRYELFPLNMTEIFRLYFYYKASWALELTFISGKYPFPDMEGIRTDGKVRNWICKYLSCLFIRQYTLHEYYIYQKHVDLPTLPSTLREMAAWLDNIEIFRESVKLIYTDTKLLKEFGFEYVNEEEILRNGKLQPNEIFEKTKANLEDAITNLKKSQDLSSQRVDEFKKKSKKIISRVFNKLRPLFNKEKIAENFGVKQITGSYNLFDRLAFCDDTDVSFLDAESTQGTIYSLNWQLSFSEILYRMKSKTYVLKQDDFFSGIDRLGLSKEEHVIISFGLNIEFYKNYKKITGLEKDDYYNETSMFHYGSFSPILSQSVIVLKKSDLPSVDFIDISDEEKSKFDFKAPIHDEYKIYADIIDINKKAQLVEDFKKRNPNKDISKSVLAVIDLFTEIRWKKDVEVIHIQMDSEFEQRGLPNKLDDIKSIKTPKEPKSENK